LQKPKATAAAALFTISPFGTCIPHNILQQENPCSPTTKQHQESMAQYQTAGPFSSHLFCHLG
jgi:hypothetical protein